MSKPQEDAEETQEHKLELRRQLGNEQDRLAGSRKECANAEMQWKMRPQVSTRLSATTSRSYQASVNCVQRGWAHRRYRGVWTKV